MVRLPTKTEHMIIKALFLVPKIRNDILVRSGLLPNLAGLPLVEYICPKCQQFKELPAWEERWEDLEMSDAISWDEYIEFADQWMCMDCEERMLQAETGGY